MNCIISISLMKTKVCLLFSFFSPFHMGVCALSVPSARMLWAEGSWRLTYKILLIKMQSILLSDLPSFLEMLSIYTRSSAKWSGF